MQFQTGGALIVHQRLVAAYGEPQWSPHGDPLDQLVATILSQHTSDVNSHRAFESLRGTFPTWEHVLAAPVAQIESAIRTGGLASLKAPRIKACLAGLLAQRGELNLDFLREMDTAAARSFLLAIPGVGPKTAACVLLFSLGRPAIPVDTHVHRVCRRVGLVPDGASAEATESILEGALPADAAYAFHLNVVAHGRQTCKAQRPVCDRCPLADVCDYARGKEPSPSPSPFAKGEERRGEPSPQHSPFPKAEEVVAALPSQTKGKAAARAYSPLPSAKGGGEGEG